MAKVGIVIPCHNCGDYITRTIDSVRRQIDPDWRMVVVDDGSVDDSFPAASAAARNDARITVVQAANVGVAAARNRGFQALAGDGRYILFLDADDLLEPDMLNVIARHMESNPQVGMAYCAVTLIDSEDQPLSINPSREGWFDRVIPTRLGVRRISATCETTPFEAVFSAPVLLPSATLIRRSVYEQTPGWDEEFGQGYEDADVCRQVAIRSIVHFIHRPFIRYRRHAKQSSVQPGRHERQLAKLDLKWHALPDLTVAQQRQVCAAEWFRDYRLGPYLGVQAGWFHLKRGRFRLAIRFLGGAARRYGLSFIRRPA